MQTQTCPVLQTSQGAAVPLTGMHISSSIDDLLTQTCVEQHYENTESGNIEAVYTFPLPIDAVLMELSVKIGARLLSASIVEKQEAEARYEEAITDGDTVVMLQKLESGMYTMNVGNLQSGEKLSVRLRYAYLQRWQGQQLRMFIPTTIAPRYGTPLNHEPQQTPQSSVLVEHHCDFSIHISGALAKARLSSPSHRISVQTENDNTWIKLQDNSALMNRDFILNIESDTDHNFGLYSKDLQGYTALASFHPDFDTTQEQPKNLKIVVDCSGSMGGDSIAQARIALTRILDSLGDGDFFNIILFGSQHQCMFARMVPALPRYLDQARQRINSIDADMGGTEIGSALQAAYKLQSEAKLANDILLITDGEIWNQESIVKQALNSRHRIFTVGVGNSVSEGFVRELATQTGGAAELVSPNENMADRILRHFKRMRAAQAKQVMMKWPQQPLRQLEFGPVYNGDTVNIHAWFKHQPGDEACLELHMQDGQVLTQTIKLRRVTDEPGVSTSTLARLAAAQRMQTLQDKHEIVETACNYQLMSLHTNYILIDVRAAEHKAQDLPELRKVPQMLAEGWGGLGTAPAVAASAPMMDKSNFHAKLKRTRSAKPRPSIPDEILLSADLSYEETLFEEPPAPLTLHSIETFAHYFSQQYTTLQIAQLNIKLLMQHGLPDHYVQMLQDLVNRGFAEQLVVLAFLEQLYSQCSKDVSRDFKRMITKLYKNNPPGEALLHELQSVTLVA